MLKNARLELPLERGVDCDGAWRIFWSDANILILRWLHKYMLLSNTCQIVYLISVQMVVWKFYLKIKKKTHKQLLNPT